MGYCYYKCDKCGKIRADDFIILTSIKGLEALVFNFCNDCIRDYNLEVIDMNDFLDEEKEDIFINYEESECLKEYGLSKEDLTNFFENDKILLTSKAFLKDLKKGFEKKKIKLENRIKMIGDKLNNEKY